LPEDRDCVVVAMAEVPEASFSDLIDWLRRAVTEEER